MKAFLLALILLVAPIAAARAQDAPGALPLFVGPPADGENLFESHIHFWKVPRPNRQTQLYIWGSVASGDSTRFRDAIDQTPKPISEILIRGSPGGDLEEGLQIGRIIHDHKLATRIPSNGVCISACNFIFLGGLIRTIDVGGKFIVHLFHLEDAPALLLQDVEQAGRSAAPRTVAEGTAPGPSAAAPVAAGDTVGHIGPPRPPEHLSDLGCDMNRVYTTDYDSMVQRQEIAAETGKDEDKIDLDNDQVKNPQRLARLRAMTMDYVCLEQSTAVASAEIAIFLVEMRMSLRFFTAFTNISNALPVPMTRDELRSFNITNTD